MNNYLCASKMICIDENLYFIGDLNGYIGEIEVETGKTSFFTNIPDFIMRNDAYNHLFFEYNSKIVILTSDGKKLVIFNPLSREFDVINCKTSNEIKGDWAGAFIRNDKIYAFFRECGVVYIFDLIERKMQETNTGINEKILWVCEENDEIVALSWDCKSLFLFNLNFDNKGIHITKKLKTDIKNKNGKIAVHCIKRKDRFIYLMNSSKVYKYDLNTDELQIIYSSLHADNGSRMIVTNDLIIIPPYREDKFFLVKNDGELSQTIEIPYNVTFGNEWEGSKTGLPFENSDYFFFPLMDADSMLLIEKETLKFRWISICFDKKDVENIVYKIIKENEIVIEDSILSLSSFIAVINRS